MDITKMTDEELIKELSKIGQNNNVVIVRGGQQMWPVIASFIRRCVQDSQKELSVEGKDSHVA